MPDGQHGAQVRTRRPRPVHRPLLNLLHLRDTRHTFSRSLLGFFYGGFGVPYAEHALFIDLGVKVRNTTKHACIRTGVVSDARVHARVRVC